ncbi:MAG: hypothetical protein F4150_07500 [Chloroflexi bacterium]|nr:hypothetical protein [Chloroflexota bacterium]
MTEPFRLPERRPTAAETTADDLYAAAVMVADQAIEVLDTGEALVELAVTAARDVVDVFRASLYFVHVCNRYVQTTLRRTVR